MILLQLYFSFLKIGAFAFGGGYAMVPLLQNEIVGSHEWITAAEFADLMSVAQITPGPIAINSATFIGYQVGGVLGSALATVAVVTPSMLIIFALVRMLMIYGDTSIVKQIFSGVKPQVIALIAAAAIGIANMAFASIEDLIIGITAAVGLYVCKLHPIAVIGLCAGAGLWLH